MNLALWHWSRIRWCGGVGHPGCSGQKTRLSFKGISAPPRLGRREGEADNVAIKSDNLQLVMVGWLPKLTENANHVNVRPLSLLLLVHPGVNVAWHGCNHEMS